MDMAEEKQKLETDNNNNEKAQNLSQQKSQMKEIIAESEDRHRLNNSRFMGIKEKSGVERKTWGENETKVKDLLQEKLSLKTEEITIERTYGIGKKE